MTDELPDHTIEECQRMILDLCDTVRSERRKLKILAKEYQRVYNERDEARAECDRLRERLYKLENQ